MTAVSQFPLTPQMLGPFVVDQVNEELAQELIKSAVARAARRAPCILTAGFPYLDEARSILLEAVVRRYDAHIGGLEAEGVLVTFLPSEIMELRALCSAASQATVTASTPVYSFPAAQSWPEC